MRITPERQKEIRKQVGCLNEDCECPISEVFKELSALQEVADAAIEYERTCPTDYDVTKEFEAAHHRLWSAFRALEPDQD